MGKLRPGSESAIGLMDSDDRGEWEAAFQSYSRSVKRLSEEKGKSELVELDRWWHAELPEAFASREADGGKAYLSKDELVRVVQWKLWIGANRPSLLAYAKATNGNQVKAKSAEAFQHLPRRSSCQPSSQSQSPAAASRTAATSTAPPQRASREAVKTAVKTLSSDIKGVGPATASAVLAAWCGGCPFDADEVIDAVRRTGKREYSLNEYLEVHEALDEKAASLGAPWDAERVRKALWSRAMHSHFEMAIPAYAPPPLPEPAAAATTAAPKSTSSSPKSAPSASSRRGGGSKSSSSNGGKNTSGVRGGREGGGVEDGGARRATKKHKASR